MKCCSFRERCLVSPIVPSNPQKLDTLLVDAVDVVDGIVRRSSKPTVSDPSVSFRGFSYRDFSLDNLILLGQDPSSLPVLSLSTSNLRLERDVMTKLNSLTPDQLYDLNVSLSSSDSVKESVKEPVNEPSN